MPYLTSQPPMSLIAAPFGWVVRNLLQLHFRQRSTRCLYDLIRPVSLSSEYIMNGSVFTLARRLVHAYTIYAEYYHVA